MLTNAIHCLEEQHQVGQIGDINIKSLRLGKKSCCKKCLVGFDPANSGLSLSVPLLWPWDLWYRGKSTVIKTSINFLTSTAWKCKYFERPKRWVVFYRQIRCLIKSQWRWLLQQGFYAVIRFVGQQFDIVKVELDRSTSIYSKMFSIIDKLIKWFDSFILH